MNDKLVSLVASCVLVILNAAPIRGVATPQLPLEVHAPEFAAILGERPKECYLPNSVYRFDPKNGDLSVVTGDLNVAACKYPTRGLQTVAVAGSHSVPIAGGAGSQ